MASRTFGGTIKLTGEDKYRKALNTIRDNLSVVSSELKAVTSSFDKNNASVDDLSNTNDVLNKKLLEQQQKLNILKKALSDAEAETGKNSVTTKKWQTELNKAQAEVNKTTLEIQKNTNQMKQLENSTNQTSNKVDDLGQSFKNAGSQSSNFADIVKGNVLADFIVSGIQALASEVVEMGKAFLEIGNTVQKSSNQMQASLGLTNEEAKEYNEIMKEIYNSNYGESFEDVAQKIGYVRQATGEVDPTKIQELTENAIALQDTFGSDFNETIRGVTNLMTHFGISSEEAFDLFAKGSQSGLDYTSELGDNIAEYGGNFAQAGYSAEEYFQLLENGTNSGAYSLDKVNDSINEVKNRLGDGTIKSNLSMFSTETQNVFKNWQNGQGTMKDVIDSIVNDISTCTNEQEQLSMAATAFGTMGEDANLKVVTSLTSLGDEFNNVKGTMESIKEIKYDDMGSAFEGIKRQLETNLITPIYNEFLPAFNDLANGLQDAMSDNGLDASKMGESIGQFIADIGTQLIEGLPQLTEFLLQGIVGLIENLAPNVGTIVETLMEGAIEIVNMLAEQVPTLLPTIVESLMNGLVSLLTNAPQLLQGAMNLITGLAQGIINSIPILIDSLPQLIQSFVSYLTSYGPTLIATGIQLIVQLAVGLIKAIPQLIAKIPEIIVAIVNGLKEGIGDVVDVGKNLVEGLWNGIKNAKDWVLDKIKGFGDAILDGIKGFFGIESPSKLFRDEIGVNLAKGVGLGFVKEMNTVRRSMENAIPNSFNVVPKVNHGFGNDVQGIIPSQNASNFNVTINNNSKYTSPAENVRLMRKEYNLYRLKYGKVA